MEDAVKELDKISVNFMEKFFSGDDIRSKTMMQNLVGEKRVGELPEEGFQKHRGNVNILIGE